MRHRLKGSLPWNGAVEGNGLCAEQADNNRQTRTDKNSGKQKECRGLSAEQADRSSRPSAPAAGVPRHEPRVVGRRLVIALADGAGAPLLERQLSLARHVRPAHQFGAKTDAQLARDRVLPLQVGGRGLARRGRGL